MTANSTKLLKVLIIEDDCIDSAALQRLLSESFLPISRVKAAVCLKDAFKLLDYEDFDVVLLDLNLPDGMGMDTLIQLNKRYPDVANVVITGQPEEDIDLKAFVGGTQEYLVKGDYDVETLTKSIHYAIEHKRISRILERKQKNLEVIFDAVPIGMMLVDENRKVTRVNDAIRRMVHRDFREIINNPVGIALGCVNCNSIAENCGKTRNCEKCMFRIAIENSLCSKKPSHKVEIQPTFIVEGKQISPWLNVNAIPAMIDGDRFTVIALEDITERKEAERKLKETMELKSRFISTVSHELRTPLACIKEGVTIILDGVTGKINEKQTHYLDIAKRNIDRLARLINDVLDFQKLESGRMEFNMNENDIVRFALDVHNIMLHSARKKDINLVLESEDQLPKLVCDGDKIIQVLTNLIDNAIKFTPRGGNISVKIGKRPHYLTISISDTGMGIPTKDIEKIFDRFHRVNRPGTQIKGTGLGLAIVNKIVKMHGGKIEVESRLEQGTTFTVFLPLDSKAAPLPLEAGVDQHLENTFASD